MSRLVHQLRALLVPLGPGTRALLLRLVGRFGFWWVLGGAAVVFYAAVRYRTWIVWMVAAWCALAWMHAPKPADEDCAEEPEAEGEQEPAHPLLGLMWKHIGDAPGVHLKTLEQLLQAAAPEKTVDRAVVRAELGALGIPVRPSVRDAAGRVNEGVHREDLKAWEEGLSPPPSVPLSKTRSNPVATDLTSSNATPATGVATPPTAHE